MREHKKLKAIELTDEIVVMIDQATRDFPKEEVYGVAERALREFSNKGIKSVIPDFRKNPGGSVNAALDVAGLFLSRLRGAFKITEDGPIRPVLPTGAQPGLTAVTRMLDRGKENGPRFLLY